MRIAVLGAGALGSIFAGTLAAETSVELVGHENPHLSAVIDEGLTVVRPDGSRETHDISATADHGAVDDADLLILAVKSYDTESAMADVEPYLDAVDVLTLQNGLGNVETIREFVPENDVLAGTTTNGAFIEEPGVVRHTGWGQTRIGRVWARNDAVVDHIAAVFRAVGFETTVEREVRRSIWKKVLVNVGINPTTALSRVQNGALVADEPGRRLLESAVREAESVANAEGYEFREDPVETARTVASETAANRSSMLQDIEQGSRTEIGSLNGAIVDIGEDHGIQVPVNRTLTDCIRLLESGQEYKT